MKYLPWVVCIFILTTSLPASAQSTPAPQLNALDDNEAPAITIRKPDNEREITEKREQGKVKEVRVQRGKNVYYLKPNEPAGSALPGDAQSNATRAPQWVVKEFDPEDKNTKQARKVEAAHTPPPPAPAGTHP